MTKQRVIGIGETVFDILLRMENWKCDGGNCHHNAPILEYIFLSINNKNKKNAIYVVHEQ